MHRIAVLLCIEMIVLVLAAITTDLQEIFIHTNEYLCRMGEEPLWPTY